MAAKLGRVGCSIGLPKALAQSDGLTAEERAFAEATEFAEGPMAGADLDREHRAMIAGWRDEDAAEEENDGGATDSQLEIIAEARQLQRYGAAICRAGYGAVLAEVNVIVAGNVNGIDVQRSRELLGMLAGALCDSGVSF